MYIMCVSVCCIIKTIKIPEHNINKMSTVCFIYNILCNLQLIRSQGLPDSSIPGVPQSGKELENNI